MAILENPPSTVEDTEWPDWELIQEKPEYRNMENVQITYCGSFTAPATDLFDASEAGFNCDEATLLQDASTIQNGPFIIFQQSLPSVVDERPSDSSHKALYTVVLESDQTHLNSNHEQRVKDDQLLTVDSSNNSMSLALLSPASALSTEDVGYASASTTPTFDDSDEGKTAERQTCDLYSCGGREGEEEGQNFVYQLDDGTEVLLTSADGLVASSEDLPVEVQLKGKRGRRNRNVGAKSGQNKKDRYGTGMVKKRYPQGTLYLY